MTGIEKLAFGIFLAGVAGGGEPCPTASRRFNGSTVLFFVWVAVLALRK